MREPGEDDDMVPLGQALADLADLRRLGLAPKVVARSQQVIDHENRGMTEYIASLPRANATDELRRAGADLKERMATWRDEREMLRDIGGDTREIDEVIALAESNITDMRAAWLALKKAKTT